MKKKKIVHLVQSLQTGGAEKLLVDLSLHCTEDFETTVVCQYQKGNYQYEKLLEENNIKIVYLNKKKGLDAQSFIDVYKALEKIKPDVVHTHLHAAIYAIPWYIRNRKAIKIHTVHTIAKMEFGRLHRRLQGLAYTLLGVIPVAISRVVKDSILKEYRLKEKRVPLIHNGIDISKYALPKKKKTNGADFEIVNVASFSKWKNQLFLLSAFYEALAETEQMHLTFVGEGPLKQTVQETAIQMGIDGVRTEFVGVSDRVPFFLNRADLFVLCSTFEGLPLSILEAFASGLPVISTNVGGVPDILQDGENGILVPLDDNDAMKSAILKLCFDVELREKMGRANQEKAKAFDIKNTTNKYIQLYASSYGDEYV